MTYLLLEDSEELDLSLNLKEYRGKLGEEIKALSKLVLDMIQLCTHCGGRSIGVRSVERIVYRLILSLSE